MVKYFNSAMGGDGSDNLANRFGQYIELYHIPSGRSVSFKAYVTTFEDSFSTNFESTEAFGRMDPIQTYRNTTRNISLAWDVPAASLFEAEKNMERASLLVSMLYPSYEDGDGGATTLSSPPIFKVKFLNLIQNNNSGAKASAKDGGLLGTISGFSYAPDLDAGFFQDSLLTEDNMIPKTVKFSCQITVLHENKVGWKSDGTHREGFNRFPYGINHPSIPEPTQTVEEITGPADGAKLRQGESSGGDITK